MSCFQNIHYKSNADLKTKNFQIDKTENKGSKSIKQYIPITGIPITRRKQIEMKPSDDR